MIALHHFTPNEFSSFERMQESLLLKLDGARERAGVSFSITSSFRDGDDGAHGRGHAVDIGCTHSKDRFRIVQAALSVGFNRIGIYDRHVHLDDDPSLPQNVMWWGTSR